ncbi:MAG: SIMPL domain-containing protein [Candidatus Levyibacteriota bacterium]
MWNSTRTPLLTVLFIFLGLLLYTKIVGPIPFSVNSITTTKSNLFTVQGTGNATAIPDTALLNLGISKAAPTVQQAQEQVNSVINQITQDMQKMGIQNKNIKTTNYSVSPNYGENQTINGYAINATVEVKIQPVDKANQAIDSATKDGATNVGDVQFILNDDKQKQLEDQARKEAIDAAKEKANSIAQASGIRLGRLADVQENGIGGPQPLPMAMQAAKGVSVDSAPTQINPGENKITSNVTLSYETF